MYPNSGKNFTNNNEFVELFEHKISEFTGAPYVVAVDRCTNAILLSLKALGWWKPIDIPLKTYLSVPMTLINYGYDVRLVDKEWEGSYQIGDSNVYDCAVGFEYDMFTPGTIQCVSFQQKKRLAIGKGGAILLDDKELYQMLKRMRHDGRDSSIPVAKENPEDVIMGYHMYMSPDEAARGCLLINQLSDSYTLGSSADYPSMDIFPVMRNYL